MLEDKNGSKTGVYQITVKKPTNTPATTLKNNTDNSIYFILGGIIGILLILIIIIIIVLKKTGNKENDEDAKNEDELSDNYDYSLKDAIDEANSEYNDEMVEQSNFKSQILNSDVQNKKDNEDDDITIFDKTQYMELSNEGIETVYYCPLAVNTDRLKRMFNDEYEVKNELYAGDISFIGSMYNEKHNLYDRLCGVNDYTKGYLDAIMKVQRSIYGYFFLEDMLKGDVLDEMMRVCPVKPNEDGVETVQYVYANYFLARRMATDERTDILSRVGRELGRENKINLYTPDASVRFINVNNKGTVDYYNEMPYVFRNSRINLNITLRSIKSGIPLRCMDICGAGGFLLSNYQADLYDVFVPGEDMVIYDSIDDLMNKCKYYLSHDAERRQIAQNGFGKIEEKHTYDVRFEEIFNRVFN